jgi:hypothetical protein
MTPVIHPPSDGSRRAHCKADKTLPPLPYLQRNHAVVDDTEVLIATPAQQHETLRSGAWATVRYARKKKRKIHIIYPDGTLKTEN